MTDTCSRCDNVDVPVLRVVDDNGAAQLCGMCAVAALFVLIGNQSVTLLLERPLGARAAS